jgi:hypothetical protein
VIYNIQKNYEGSSVNSSPVNANHCTFNPLDKLMEVIEENKKYSPANLQFKQCRQKRGIKTNGNKK